MIDVYLVHQSLESIVNNQLPKGYHFTLFKEGNEKDLIIGINKNENVHYYKYNFKNKKLEIEGEINEH